MVGQQLSRNKRKVLQCAIVSDVTFLPLFYGSKHSQTLHTQNPQATYYLLTDGACMPHGVVQHKINIILAQNNAHCA